MFLDLCSGKRFLSVRPFWKQMEFCVLLDFGLPIRSPDLQEFLDLSMFKRFLEVLLGEKFDIFGSALILFIEMRSLISLLCLYGSWGQQPVSLTWHKGIICLGQVAR